MEESTAPTSATNTVDTTRPQPNTQRSNSENSNFRISGSNSSGSSGYGGKPTSLPIAQKDINRTMEDNATTASISNAVDSAFSQSNSRSLSSESSQCRMRDSNSSGSSGYGGKQTKAMLQAQAENSASSGNSAELTTTKNLKRSKNKGRKKKSKTKQSQNRQIDATETIQETKSQENKSITPTLEKQTTLVTDTIKPEDVSTNAENKINRIVESIPDKQDAEGDTLQKEIQSDIKQTHEHSANPLSSSESMKDKSDSHLNDENLATDKSPVDDGDLEVDNILSYSKVEQQTAAEHRANLIQESFCCAISMHDGVILSTTANLTESLGFPKDVWLGRAFIDFVHPKDRPTFASQITSGYIDHISLKGDYLRQSNLEKTPLYVLLRCYRSFDECGFAVKNKPISYKPFKLIFRKAPEMPSNSTSAADGNSALRIICAIALSSIYTVPDENMKKQNAKFSTRHTAAGILVHIDGTSVSAIGFMPQDIIGKSILDFFHPEDMMLLKTAYELLMKNTQVADGRVSSPPYRFLIKNGCYITLETEWTKVFNPWSRKLEFVTGDHCVLRGPKYCDIFTKTGIFAYKFPNEVLEKAAALKRELLKLLSEPVPYPSDSVKQQVSKRCQALASFMESLLAGVKRQELKLDWLSECEPAASEHGSVMLGEISPHHHSNHDDSKSSSETPPTYNQLNYFENLNRFFNSVQPTFIPNEFKSLPYQIDHVPTNEKDRMLSPIQQCGEESGGSFNSSSDSPQFESTNTSNTSNNGTTNKQNLVLTETLVARHTDDMELQMVKNHKKYRTRVTDKKKAPDKGYNSTARNQPVKRSWPNELGKNSKAHDQNEQRYALTKGAQNNESLTKTEVNKSFNDGRPSTNYPMIQNNKVQAVHLWPPFSVNTTTPQNNIPTNTIPNSINPFLLSKHLSTPILPTPRYYVNPNRSSDMDQTPSDYTPKDISGASNGVTGNLSNPYTLQYIKNLMRQPQPFLNQNMIYPYPPIAYQPLPMLQQRADSKAQASGATNVSLEMPSTPTQQSIRKMNSNQLSNMTLYGNVQNTEPINLSTTANQTAAKLEMKDDSDEIDASNSSFSSSFFDSQLRTTDESWESDKTSKDDTMMGNNEQNAQAGKKKRGKIPYWMKNVNSSPDLVLRYQLRTKEIDDALQADLRVLREINQPGMVNEQLDQLYFELDLENQCKNARISLGDTPSNSSEDEENMSKKKKNSYYSELSMIYEENAPVQPPV